MRDLRILDNDPSGIVQIISLVVVKEEINGRITVVKSTTIQENSAENKIDKIVPVRDSFDYNTYHDDSQTFLLLGKKVAFLVSVNETDRGDEDNFQTKIEPFFINTRDEKRTMFKEDGKIREKVKTFTQQFLEDYTDKSKYHEIFPLSSTKNDFLRASEIIRKLTNFPKDVAAIVVHF
jgi:hypothetical protein